ncbi:MAG TPA: Ig-like domain-containing protein, partial [Vicinamibacteria bacterium]|nr:Ig-like domain-containing protein [Vicinamibacteria bacterium]
MTSPTSGTTVGGTIPVSASVTVVGGLTVQGVQFKLDGANLGAEDTAAPYSIPWDTKAATNASHTLTAVGRDALGGSWTSDPVTVTVFNDKTPPTVALTSPAAGAAVKGTIAIGADASDNVGVVGVQFKLDGVNVGAEDAASPYSVSWNTAAAADGSHLLTAVARDAAGNTATSVAIPVVVDNSPPSVAITEPAMGVLVAGTTIVDASASDSIGVAGVQLMVDGAAAGIEDTSAPFAFTWDTTSVASGTHTLAAVARDAAGNTSTSATVTVMVSQTATRIENTELSITYTAGNGTNGQSPNWWSGSRSRAWSGKVASFTRGDGARAAFTFTGSTIRWIGFRAPWAGIARVYLDDVFVSELDLYQTTEEPQAVVFARTGLAAGPHTLMVECTGRRNPSSVDYAVVVDAFDVAPAAPAPVTGTRVEEPAMTFGAGWTAEAAGVRNWSGGSAEISATPGAQATYSFIGTEVRWIGLRGPQNGIARVYLDGSFHAQVDTYASMELETVVFTAMNLTPGRHTMTIEVTGDKNAASTGTSVVVDGLDVRSRFEDQDHALTHTADWRDPFVNGLWSGTSANRTGLAWLSNTAGGQATFTFSGTSVSWIGSRGPLFGIASVLVDGAYVTDVDTYAPVQQDQAVLFTASGLTDAAHTVTIQPTGGKNAAAIGAWIVVDAFDVTLSPSVPSITRLQETDASVNYSSGWNSYRYPLFAGETMMGSSTTGAQATFTFTG